MSEEKRLKLEGGRAVRELGGEHQNKQRGLWFAGFLCAALVFLSGISCAWGSSYFISGQTGASLNSASLNLGIEGGLRFDDFGILGKVDWNPWFNTQDFKGSLKAGVLNVGVGGEYLYFDERCRTALFVGPSILLFDTALDEKGTVGFFVDIITVSLRWPVSDSLTMRLDPASVHLVIPVVSGIPLVSFQYRHTLAIEWSL